MAQLYQNRHKNAESHLFGDEPPPEHYEIAPETIQGLRDANNNRRKAMESNLFSPDSKPNVQNTQISSPDSDNRYKNLESHLAFGATPTPQNQPQFSQPNQILNAKYQAPSYTNQKPRYQPPQMPPPQIHLKPKLQPLAPAPNQDEYNFRQSTNQATSLLKQFRQNQDQTTQQFTQLPAQPQQQTRAQISQIDYSSIPNLSENLAQIDNSLPSISPRKFVIEDRNNQNNDNQQQPPQLARAPITTPRHPTFIYTQVKETQLPTFQVSDLVQNSQIPQLSPFPNFDFDLAPIDNNFAFAVKPLTSSGQRYPKKLNLNNSAGTEMKKMRDELEKDAQQFDTRIKRIEKVEIVQPMRPVTPAADDPPTLDFSFATPRSMWNLDRRPNTDSNPSRRGRGKSEVPDLNLTNTMNEGFSPNNNNNGYYDDATAAYNNNDDDDDGGGAGLMSTQSDFIYLDNQNMD